MTNFFSFPPASSMNFSNDSGTVRVAAADDEQRAFRWTVLRRVGRRRRLVPARRGCESRNEDRGCDRAGGAHQLPAFCEDGGTMFFSRKYVTRLP